MSLSSETGFYHWLSSEQAREGHNPKLTQAQTIPSLLRCPPGARCFLGALIALPRKHRIRTTRGTPQLNFQDLKAFEQVTDQYQHLGAEFSQAIALVGSMGAIIPRTSLLDPDVRVSPHPAPDNLVN